MKKNRWFAVIPAMVMVLAIPGFSEGSGSKKMQGNKLANLALAESSKGSYSNCVVGDFVLKDGTVLSKDETPEIGTVAAVIVRAATDDKPALGVGIVHKKSSLTWCTLNVEGFYTNITALQGDETSGYTDGSDGWEKLKEACPDAESNPVDYPAWNYCRNYGANNGLTGNLATGWYLPTVAELYTIYQNKDVVNESLLKADGNRFGVDYYWSCCQDSSDNHRARAEHFYYGEVYNGTKYDYTFNVCSVRAFPGFSEGSDSKKMQGNKLAHLALAESSKGSYSDCVVGDFVLKDGTVLSKDETPEIGTVAAVIVRAATDGKPALGVGIVHNREGLAWCTYDAIGNYVKITALMGDQTSGYTDGSDGWEKLKKACPDAESNPGEYPAWNYCRNYGANNGLTGDLATGWYLPTVAELYTIYQNKTVVDESLSKAGGNQFGKAYFYWSCCHYPSSYCEAQGLNFNEGYMIGTYKYDTESVCSVRAFN